MVVMAGCIKISALLLLLFVCTSYERPRETYLATVLRVFVNILLSEFNFGSILTNGLGAAFNTALGRDCKGRPQGDYFYGCQVRVSRMFLLIMILSIVCRTLQYWKAQEIRSEYCEQAVYQQQSR